MMIDGMADPMLLTICFLTSYQLCPSETAITPPAAAASSSAIWLAPARVSSPKKYTFSDKSKISRITGVSAWIIVGSLMVLFIRR